MITKYLATKKLLFVIIAAMIVFLGNSATAASIANNPDAVVGVWKTGDGNAIVRIICLIFIYFFSFKYYRRL